MKLILCKHFERRRGGGGPALQCGTQLTFLWKVAFSTLAILGGEGRFKFSSFSCVFNLTNLFLVVPLLRYYKKAAFHLHKCVIRRVCVCALFFPEKNVLQIFVLRK